jgi:YHYH protein
MSQQVRNLQSKAPLHGAPLLAVGGILATILLAATTTARAHDDHGNRVSITVQGDQRCIVSNGLPNHSTGQFPTRGNPNTISAQNIRLCVAAHPHKNSQPTPVDHGPIGVAINGVEIRPETAEYYDPSSPRGFSRDRSSGWNVEGLGAKAMLGMDQNNAHVDHSGLYHYHGVPKGLVASVGSSLIGYAADGFEIHYVGNRQTSSYRLKSGTRPSGPGGKYDGTYIQDWEYVAGSGTLDVCNGSLLNGKYVYFATRTFPFYPRCMWGDISTDFQQAPHHGGGFQASAGPGRGATTDGRAPRGPAGRRSGPPAEAVSACANQPDGARCTFNAPGRRISGACRVTPEGVSACVPRGGRPRS